jgi:hypothetical protein
MIFAFNGCGTKYHAEPSSYSQHDGTITITKWIVFFYLRIIPLASYRARYLGDQGIPIRPSAKEYQIVQRIPLDLRGTVLDRFACIIVIMAILFLIARYTSFTFM